jgi:hypothetical protein
MDRRSFVALLATTPFLADPPVTPYLHTERRYESTGRVDGTFSRMQIEVFLSLTERTARDIYRWEATDPFDGVVGEFYISGSQRVDIPEAICGSLTAFDTIVGVAAKRGTVHVGGLKRGKFIWILRGGPVEHMMLLFEQIMAFELPEETEVWFKPVLLERLIPDPEMFPSDIEVLET